MRGPPGVRYSGRACNVLFLNLRHQIHDPGGAAGSLQAISGYIRMQTAGVNCHATGVIATVLKALQALHKNRNDIAIRNSANNATHNKSLKLLSGCYAMQRVIKNQFTSKFEFKSHE
jgi:hypothetical protein